MSTYLAAVVIHCNFCYNFIIHNDFCDKLIIHNDFCDKLIIYNQIGFWWQECG